MDRNDNKTQTKIESETFVKMPDSDIYEDESVAASGEDNLLNSLLLLSVKTLFYLLLILSVSAASFSRIFPFQTMKFYRDMENYSMAVKYAKDYVNRGGKNNFDAIFQGLQMSEELLYGAENNAEVESAAEYILYFTGEFAALPDFKNHCSSLDSYYSQNAASTVEKVGFYSFKDYVFSLNTAAASALKKADKLMYNGDLVSVSESGYISIDELNRLFRDVENKNIDSKNFSTTLLDLAVIFNQLSENIVWGEGSLIFDTETTDTTSLYDLTLLCLKSAGENNFGYIDEVAEMPPSLMRLYTLRAAAILGENIKALFGDINNWSKKKERLAEVKEVFSVLNEEKQISLYDYYRLELSKL